MILLKTVTAGLMFAHIRVHHDHVNLNHCEVFHYYVCKSKTNNYSFIYAQPRPNFAQKCVQSKEKSSGSFDVPEADDSAQGMVSALVFEEPQDAVVVSLELAQYIYLPSFPLVYPGDITRYHA